MPVAVTYPGVYIQEVPSGVRTITGVATSIAAFVDFFAAGPLGSSNAVQIFSFADFERQFGGLDTRSEASYAIQQFFLNGGTEAYVVRATSSTHPAEAAAIDLQDQVGGSTVLTATARSPGGGGNHLRLDVDYGTTDPASQFNLTVTQVATGNNVTSVVATEKFLNLVIDPSKSNDAAAVVTAGSQLVTLTEASGSTGKRPAQTGTASKALTLPLSSLNLTTADTMDVKLGAIDLSNTAALGAVPTTLSDLAAALQGLLRGLQRQGAAALPNATVSVAGSASTRAYLIVKSGTPHWSDFLTLSDGGSGLATKLGFAAGTENVQQYALGGAAAQAQTNPKPGTDGGDLAGSPPAPPIDAKGLIGDSNAKTGMYALLDVDLFNILCIPATMNLGDNDAFQVATDATGLCAKRRAMYVLDVPQHDAMRDTVPNIMTWLDGHAGLRSKDAALYFPRMDIADPLNGFRLRKVAPSGTVAGIWARTDGTRGVWKAPAGTEATLTGVQQLEYKLTDPENGVLNPLAINCLRTFPIYGPVCWGARTLNGADQIADDYKYIPVRRLALFIEESLYRGTQWVVFEPNDTPLWAQIRLNVGAFMQTLFRQGAFQGNTPKDAYFVLCDATTNPQASINLGIVNIVVGFAPLKPAEFVVITIQQIAGQLAT
jgi:phage tail sheath protein FI